MHLKSSKKKYHFRKIFFDPLNLFVLCFLYTSSSQACVLSLRSKVLVSTLKKHQEKQQKQVDILNHYFLELEASTKRQTKKFERFSFTNLFIERFNRWRLTQKKIHTFISTLKKKPKQSNKLLKRQLTQELNHENLGFYKTYDFNREKTRLLINLLREFPSHYKYYHCLLNSKIIENLTLHNNLYHTRNPISNPRNPALPQRRTSRYRTTRLRPLPESTVCPLAEPIYIPESQRGFIPVAQKVLAL